MCGIAGWIKLTSSRDDVFDGAFNGYFRRVLEVIAARGPDAFGYAHVQANGRVSESLYPPGEYTPKAVSHYRAVAGEVACVANFRGIPTTEAEPTIRPELATQPFVVGGFHLTHNGLFSNDRAVGERYGFKSLTGAEHDIDTYALGKLLCRYSDHNTAGVDGFSAVAQRALSEIEGSYAVAVYSEVHTGIILARSFRGLWLTTYESRQTGDVYLVWASEAAPLKSPYARGVHEFPLDSYYAASLSTIVDAFTRGDLDVARSICAIGQRVNPAREAEKVRRLGRVAVVLSGGLDSTVCATLAAADFKTSEVHLLHFNYGARAGDAELCAVTEIASFLRRAYPDKTIKLELIDLSFLRDLGGSTLTDPDGVIAKGEVGVETAHEWVPARNLVMISMAAAYCDRHDVGRIMLGLNMEEGSVYPDNSVEFYTELQRALVYGARSQPKLDMPLGNSMKHHIVRRGLDAGAPLHLSWSCYENGEYPCGACGPDLMRLRAFAMNNEPEVQTYAAYPDWFPEELRPAPSTPRLA